MGCSSSKNVNTAKPKDGKETSGTTGTIKDRPIPGEKSPETKKNVSIKVEKPKPNVSPKKEIIPGRNTDLKQKAVDIFKNSVPNGYEGILEEIESQQETDLPSHEIYSDPYFSADTTIMCQPFDDWDERPFKRPDDYCPGAALFKGIDPSDIRQGVIGDCWLCSAIASLAEWPDRIKRLFDQTEISSNGAYTVNLYFMGAPVKIVVDDQVPCNDFEPFQPCVTSSKDAEIWIPILEKACAKFHDGYEYLVRENKDYAFEFLTAAPSFDLAHNRTQDMIEQIEEAESRNWIITTQTQDSSEQFTGENLVSGHAYSVLSIHTVQSEGEDVRLLKLRNTWGETEWNGDWSDHSDLWTKELRDQLKHEAEDDGVFFINETDYLEHFDYTAICYYEDNFTSSTIRVAEQRAYFSFTLTEPMAETSFILAQPGPKMFGRRELYEPEIQRFIVGRLTSNGKYDFIAGAHMSGIKRVKNLKPGQYKVFAAVDWTNTDICDEWSFRIYSDQMVEIEKEGEDLPFLREVICSAASKDQDSLQECHPDHPGMFQGCDWYGNVGFTVLYLENSSRNEIMTVEVEISEYADGLTLSQEFEDSNKHSITLQPNEKYCYPHYWVSGHDSEYTPYLTYTFEDV